MQVVRLYAAKEEELAAFGAVEPAHQVLPVDYKLRSALSILAIDRLRVAKLGQRDDALKDVPKGAQVAGKNTAVFGIYRDRTSVENAVDVLRQEDFRNTDISVLFPENQGTKDFAHEKNTKAPEGAATGAGSGAVIGGTLGWLTGIGALAIPGVGPFIAAGPIVAALAGVGVGGAIGGIAGALIGLGIPVNRDP